MKRPILFLGGVLLLAAMTAAAQDDPLSGTGRELSMIPKRGTGLTGSLGISYSQSSGRSGGQDGTGYGATLGGTLITDRVWFFATGEQQSARVDLAYSYGANGVDARVMANLGDRQNLALLFADGKRTASPQGDDWIPSSFLSMRYTGILSPNAFFSASVSRSTSSQSVFSPDIAE